MLTTKLKAVSWQKRTWWVLFPLDDQPYFSLLVVFQHHVTGSAINNKWHSWQVALANDCPALKHLIFDLMQLLSWPDIAGVENITWLYCLWLLLDGLITCEKMGAWLGTIAGRFWIGMDVSQDEISPYVHYRIPLDLGDSVSFHGSSFFLENW